MIYLHSSVEGRKQIQWNLSIPHERGVLNASIWGTSRKILRSPFWILFIRSFFKRVSKKYMISWFVNIFDPIFGIYGIFYDQCYPSLDPKMLFCGWNIELKLQFLMYLAKWRKWDIKRSPITKRMQCHNLERFSQEF